MNTRSVELKAKKIKPNGKKRPELKANVVIDNGPRAQLLVWDAVCKAYRNKKNGKFVQYGDSKKRNRKSLTKKQIAEIDRKARKVNKEFSDAQYAKNSMTAQETFNTWISRFARDFAHNSVLNLSRAYDQRYSTEKFEDVLKSWQHKLVIIVSNAIESAIKTASTFKDTHNETYRFGENFGIEKVFSLATALESKNPLARQGQNELAEATEQLMTYEEILNYEEQRRENDIAQFEEDLVKNLKAMFEKTHDIFDTYGEIRRQVKEKANQIRKGNKNG